MNPSETHFTLRGAISQFAAIALVSTGLVFGSFSVAGATANDGTGTLTTKTSTVAAGSTKATITFSYTVAAGGINGGEVDVTVPNGWSTPSTATTSAGYATASSGTMVIGGQTIRVAGLNLSAGSVLTITYGSRVHGGPGATATSSVGASTWSAIEKSSLGGTLTHLAVSPSITVNSTLSTPVAPTLAVESPTSILVTFKPNVNAQSSTVTVYLSSNHVAAKTVTGNTTGSELVTGLTGGVSYYASIASVGNGTTYLNSANGARSLDITPGVLTIVVRSIAITTGQSVDVTSYVSGLTPADKAVINQVAYTYVGKGTTSYGPSATAPGAVGTYTVTPSGASVTITPNADQGVYGKTLLYTSGALTISTPTVRPLHATRVTSAAWTGRTVTLSILGTGFTGQPRIISSTGRGTRAVVTRDTGIRLTLRVTVRAGTPRGVHVFKITLANGASCNVHYSQY